MNVLLQYDDFTPSIGVFMKGPKDYSRFSYKYSPCYSLRYNFLWLFPEYYEPIGSGIYKIWIKGKIEEKRTIKKLHTVNLFSWFVGQLKENSSFLSIEISQIDFVKKYILNYLIYLKNAIRRPELQELIEKEIIDSKTGETICILKTPKNLKFHNNFLVPL